MSRTMTTAEAIQEARRCLNCARPTCRTGCPIENNIPGFIRALSEGNIGMAYEIISERSNLPAICGRVCPHERQCEAHCVLTKKKCGIEIGSLEMFIADFAHNNDLKPTQPSSKLRGKVAVIGSGPAGLTCASLIKIEFCISHLLITINSRLYKRVAAAFPVGNKKMTYPDGHFNSYGSCSRHLLRELFLQLGKYIFPVRKNIFPD